MVSTVIIRRIGDGHDSKFPVSHRVWCIVSNLPVLGIGRVCLRTQTTIIELLNPHPMMVFIWMLQHGDSEMALPFHLVRETLDELEDLIVSCGQQRDVLPYLSVYYQQEIAEQGSKSIWRLGNATMAAFWKGDHEAFEKATKLYIQRLSLREWQLEDKRNNLVPDLIRGKSSEV